MEFTHVCGEDAYSSVMSSNPLPSSGPYQLPPVCQSMASMHSNPLQVQSIQRSGQNVPVPVTKSVSASPAR